MARNEGTQSRKLVSLNGQGFYPAWSPDGSRLRFTVIDDKTRGNSLWEVSAQGINLHPLFPGWHNPADECCGKWTTDGKYFAFESRGQIWALSEAGTFLHRSTGKPIQLTSSPLRSFTPLPSKDGKKLFVVGRSYRGQLQRGESKPGLSRPFSRASPLRTSCFQKMASGWPTYPTPKAFSGAASRMVPRKYSSAPLHCLPRCRAGRGRQQIVFYNYQSASQEGSTRFQLTAAVPSNYCRQILRLSRIRTGRRTATKLFLAAYRRIKIRPCVCSI